MQRGKEVTIMDVINWQEQQREGFSGILTDPRGERGFLSKIGGATSWYVIGEGQNETELMIVAKQLHDLMGKEHVDPDLLSYLGKRARELSQPKSR